MKVIFNLMITISILQSINCQLQIETLPSHTIQNHRCSINVTISPCVNGSNFKFYFFNIINNNQSSRQLYYEEHNVLTCYYRLNVLRSFSRTLGTRAISVVNPSICPNSSICANFTLEVVKTFSISKPLRVATFTHYRASFPVIINNPLSRYRLNLFVRWSDLTTTRNINLEFSATMEGSDLKLIVQLPILNFTEPGVYEIMFRSHGNRIFSSPENNLTGEMIYKLEPKIVAVHFYHKTGELNIEVANFDTDYQLRISVFDTGSGQIFWCNYNEFTYTVIDPNTGQYVCKLRGSIGVHGTWTLSMQFGISLWTITSNHIIHHWPENKIIDTLIVISGVIITVGVVIFLALMVNNVLGCIYRRHYPMRRSATGFEGFINNMYYPSEVSPGYRWKRRRPSKPGKRSIRSDRSKSSSPATTTDDPKDEEVTFTKSTSKVT